MSDENDETRRSSPDDAVPRKPADPDATQVGGLPADPDATQVGGLPADPDATQVGGGASDLDATRVDGAAVPGSPEDDTLPGAGGRDDDTVADGSGVPTVVHTQPGETAVIPPVDDDWAPSRANPAWSGRAEVRPPQPGDGYVEEDWAAGTPPPQQRDRWWMPIVVGIIALILLAVLGWAIWLIVRDTSEDETPAPVVTTSATPSETATTETSSPSPTPTTTSPSPSPSPSSATASPTPSEVQIPALRGLSLPEAQVALRTTGLNYRLIYRQAPDVPPGTVIDSDPVEGQEVPPDTTITLVIAAEATNTPATPTAPVEDGGEDQN